MFSCGFVFFFNDTATTEIYTLSLHDALPISWFDDKVIVAMAGIHQLWWFDPIKRTVGVYAGTTVESLRDGRLPDVWMAQDRKSTRLNSSHANISYAVFCLKKKKNHHI